MIKVTHASDSVRVQAEQGSGAVDLWATDRTMTASLHLPSDPEPGQVVQLDVGRISGGRAYVVFRLEEATGYREVATYLPRPMLVLLQDAIEEVLENTGRGERTYTAESAS